MRLEDLLQFVVVVDIDNVFDGLVGLAQCLLFDPHIVVGLHFELILPSLIGTLLADRGAGVDHVELEHIVLLGEVDEARVRLAKLTALLLRRQLESTRGPHSSFPRWLVKRLHLVIRGGTILTVLFGRACEVGERFV